VSVRRTLTTLTPEDRSGDGAPKLYGYGRRWIERISGKSTRTVERALASGDLNPGDPVSVVAWCAAARGRTDLAADLRTLLGGGVSLFRRPAKPEPRLVSAYLMLARDRDGAALGLTIASSENLANYGKICRWERAPRPYAQTSAATFDAANTKILLAIVMDADPWPDELAPLVEELLGVEASGSPHRRLAPGDQRARDLETILEALEVPLADWPSAELARVAAAIRRGKG